MDTVYRNAIAKRDDLRRQLEEIETFLRLYRQYSSDTKQERPEPDQSEASNVNSVPSERHRRRVKPSELANIIERILQDRDKPMQRGEIVQALEERDVDFESQDRPRYIGTILWRNGERFVNIPGEGYTLAAKVTPEQKRKIFEANLDALFSSLSQEVKETLDGIASEYAGELDVIAMHETVTMWNSIERFPAEIDGPLLSKARNDVGRELNPSERRYLRNRMMSHLQSYDDHSDLI